ncbi:MAG: hypothetical protein K9G46_13620 [Flavobacteriales bacterium]|nr:hypothetical protein [Flavobacteriales bacterium]
MKKALFPLVILIALSFSGCRKADVDIRFKTIYTNGSSHKKSLHKESSTNNAFTQFGDFVGTITPRTVTGTFRTIRYTDNDYSVQGATTIIDVINGNWQENDPRKFADFTNGNTVEVIPDMYGDMANGWYAKQNINLKYLGISPNYLLFEFDLPENYDSVELLINHFPNSGYHLPNGFNALAVREGRAMKCLSGFFTQHEFNGSDNAPEVFVFGEADSCFVIDVDASNLGSIEYAAPFGVNENSVVARSGNYIAPILTDPVPNQDKVITTTIGFDSENLIEIYAGLDNVPYTFDDVFVFTPLFWNRFDITLEQN